ncbi:phenylalanyl-tRNA synthetase [Eremomyces bilateralis CBS 781.70]|uniref:Phenylalanine--tRNA ligase beta subunit n=1 Tax=Eremomyces bilateralis CBS 781.70 TaxID=1392243 RepID=A0A6G1GEW7_9PEZI|nr:phenylalanyl-tRNA synthetase [Eremomyces bilateralis CBS 781.70]KAF1816574.1 phenylalanyl-tRNA synthetase [Eremomyces bilateralis CBS 781.70]
MPTISCDKVELYKALGKDFTTEEFDELCFEFGIELDEDTTDQKRPIVDGVEEPPQLKIEIPANRYDMVCFEGIARALNVFLQRMKPPSFRVIAPPEGELQTMVVKEDTTRIRPLISCAILRGITFTKDRYASFIALQDKLHANLARQRTLVSVGTHDLDTIKGPFTYEALPPEEINFVPLNQTNKMNGKELMEYYDKDKHLGKFLHIIRDSPVYPVIYDANRTVLSLPPIINGDHSKITLNTRNILIEITATDQTKVEIVNHILCAMFSEYCDTPFTVEPVQIISPHNHASRQSPDLTPREIQASVAYINSCCGLDLPATEICHLLTRMGHHAVPSPTDPDLVDIAVPITRADVLHQADIMEDVAVAYGFNRLPRYYPNSSAAVGAALPMNKLGDVVRIESATAGWTEVMPLILCSHDENFAWLNRVDDGTTAVRLANPKSAEYQIVRTSLLPGVLKTIRENKHRAVPLKVFEVSDVCFKDETRERKTRNERHFCAAWYGKSSGFEVVHGLLDRVLAMLNVRFLMEAKELDDATVDGYWIEEFDHPTFFVGHAASVVVRQDGQKQVVGHFGILHPTVLKNFELPYPVSALEINLEVFL